MNPPASPAPSKTDLRESQPPGAGRGKSDTPVFDIFCKAMNIQVEDEITGTKLRMMARRLKYLQALQEVEKLIAKTRFGDREITTHGPGPRFETATLERVLLLKPHVELRGVGVVVPLHGAKLKLTVEERHKMNQILAPTIQFGAYQRAINKIQGSLAGKGNRGSKSLKTKMDNLRAAREQCGQANLDSNESRPGDAKSNELVRKYQSLKVDFCEGAGSNCDSSIQKLTFTGPSEVEADLLVLVIPSYKDPRPLTISVPENQPIKVQGPTLFVVECTVDPRKVPAKVGQLIRATSTLVQLKAVRDRVWNAFCTSTTHGQLVEAYRDTPLVIRPLLVLNKSPNVDLSEVDADIERCWKDYHFKRISKSLGVPGPVTGPLIDKLIFPGVHYDPKDYQPSSSAGPDPPNPKQPRAPTGPTRHSSGGPVSKPPSGGAGEKPPVDPETGNLETWGPEETSQLREDKAESG